MMKYCCKEVNGLTSKYAIHHCLYVKVRMARNLKEQQTYPSTSQPVTLLTRKRTKPINKCRHYFYYNTPAC